MDTFFWRSKRKYLAFGCEYPINTLSRQRPHYSRHQCWFNDRVVSPSYCNIYVNVVLKLSGFKLVAVCLYLDMLPFPNGLCQIKMTSGCIIPLIYVYFLLAFRFQRVFQTQWLNGKSVRFTPNPTLPPQRYISKVSSRCHCVMHGKVMKQVNPTYKPGDRPDSIYATAEGCSAKCLCALVCSIFYCPPMLYSISMRGRRRGHYAKNYSQFPINHGF